MEIAFKMVLMIPAQKKTRHSFLRPALPTIEHSVSGIHPCKSDGDFQAYVICIERRDCQPLFHDPAVFPYFEK